MLKAFRSLLIPIMAVLVLAIAILLPLPARGQNAVYYRDQVAVLMYHHVHPEDTSSATITTDLFREQLTFLQSKGYTFISLADFKQYLKGAAMPPNAVLVTFDDGYESYYQEAYPVMKKLGVPAVKFLITETIEKPNDWGMTFMSQAQIDAIRQDNPRMEFGCHTNSLHTKLTNGEAALVGRVTLPDGSLETDAQYDTRILNDISMCIKKSSPASAPVDILAYPYGIYSDRAIALLKQLGIRYAFTVQSGMTTREVDPFKIPRINAGSPWITPERLHASIMRTIAAVPAGN